MEKPAVEKKYDGSEMDEINSPPFKMIGLFLLIAAIGFLYAILWGVLLKP